MVDGLVVCIFIAIVLTKVAIDDSVVSYGYIQ